MLEVTDHSTPRKWFLNAERKQRGVSNVSLGFSPFRRGHGMGQPGLLSCPDTWKYDDGVSVKAKGPRDRQLVSI